jgi:hypothetical protein
MTSILLRFSVLLAVTTFGASAHAQPRPAVPAPQPKAAAKPLPSLGPANAVPKAPLNKMTPAEMAAYEKRNGGAQNFGKPSVIPAPSNSQPYLLGAPSLPSKPAIVIPSRK